MKYVQGLIGAGILLAAACNPRQADQPAGLPASVSLGVGLESLAALPLIAHDQGFFQRQGLTLSVTGFPSGKVALGALLTGTVEITTCASTPFVLESFGHRDLRLLAVIGTADNELKIMARRDLGIQQPPDLRGRRVATQKASSLHFFLHLFLLKNGLSESDVTVSFAAPEALPKLLRDGTVDAVAIREPLISHDGTAPGQGIVIFQDPGLYVKYYQIVTTEAFLRQKPRIAEHVLRALGQAEEFARQKPAVAEATVARALGIPASVLMPVWSDLDLRISLPQSVLLELEDQARWCLASGLVETGPLPNYLTFIHERALEAVNPKAVTIIR